MRVFVTGSTGFVGSAVVKDLINAGHQVVGLVRSQKAAQSLVNSGGEPHFGDVEDLDSLRRGAAKADGVIHTAFNHDFSKFAANCENDRRAIIALGDELGGSDRPLVVTSGTGLLTPGQLATEDARVADGPAASPRVASELAVDALADRGVRASVVRLPPSVHGEGDHGFVPILINLAREKGVAAYIGEGNNVWAAAHRFDAAPVYRLALGKANAGDRFHAVAEQGIPFRDLAGAIGRGLGIPVSGLDSVAAAAHFGWFTHFAGIDCPSSSRWTRERLGWEPTHPGLLSDLEKQHYFEA